MFFSLIMFFLFYYKYVSSQNKNINIITQRKFDWLMQSNNCIFTKKNKYLIQIVI